MRTYVLTGPNVIGKATLEVPAPLAVTGPASPRSVTRDSVQARPHDGLAPVVRVVVAP